MGVDRQQQHVEFFEEPDPALRDLPTSRVAEQPARWLWIVPRIAAAASPRGFISGAQGKGGAGARADVDRSTEKAAMTRLKNSSCEVARSTGMLAGCSTTRAPASRSAVDRVVDGAVHVFIDGAVRIIGPHRDPKVLECRCSRRGSVYEKPPSGFSGPTVASSAGMMSRAPRACTPAQAISALTPPPGVSRPAGDVADQRNGLPCRLMAVEATEVGRNPGRATDFGPEVEAREAGCGRGGAPTG